jgi:hypothetical protein
MKPPRDRGAGQRIEQIVKTGTGRRFARHDVWWQTR